MTIRLLDLGSIETFQGNDKNLGHLDVDCITCRKNDGLPPTTRSKISLQCNYCLSLNQIKTTDAKDQLFARTTPK